MCGYSVFIETKGCIVFKNDRKWAVQEKKGHTYMFMHFIATLTFPVFLIKKYS